MAKFKLKETVRVYMGEVGLNDSQERLPSTIIVRAVKQGMLEVFINKILAVRASRYGCRVELVHSLFGNQEAMEELEIEAFELIIKTIQTHNLPGDGPIIGGG